MSFEAVKKALEQGADPAMLCMTCPWDRFCITPPSMTSQDVQAKIAEASAADDAKAREAAAMGNPAGMPIGSIMTALTLSGRDSMATVCPVFAARLRDSMGRYIVEGLKASMVGFDSSQVAS